MDSGLKETRLENPRENAFPLSSVTFWYTIPTFLRGLKGDLNESDLPETLSEHKSANLGNLMERYWQEEELRAAGKKAPPSLLRVLIRAFGLEFMFYGVVLFISESIRINQPILLGKLISYFKVDANHFNITKLNSSVERPEA
ncbi:probable multidrug resistance-associated protein lethal(2)03659 [Dendroctonus ponderosae]|uniref:probable multidrug resistance-associated protein lethal(2)03659 n=1 Tax=Dendroctonus ponderosae TaxID=77166 RepID=UPI002034C058|nr:probable multidrug resistance-associated protein lethal(2)03659 [Dendroctonus ponderosae]